MTVMSKDQQYETVVTDDGVVVPLSDLGDLVPGQRVRVSVAPAKKNRRDLYGVMAGTGTSPTREEIKEVSREAWGDWIW